MIDDAAKIRHDLEVERLTAELANTYQRLAPEVIEHGVRAEFDRWSASRVQDFVPIFVERAVRQKLRALGYQDPGRGRPALP